MTASQGNRVAMVMVGGFALLGLFLLLVGLLGAQVAVYAAALLGAALMSGAGMYLAMHVAYTRIPFKAHPELYSLDEYIAAVVGAALLAVSVLLTKQTVGPTLVLQGMQYLALPVSFAGCAVGFMRACLAWERSNP